MSWRSRVLPPLALELGLGGGCDCKRGETLAPVEVGGAGEDFELDAAELLAPTWPEPRVRRLDDGALLTWLHDDQSPNVHVRLMLPTTKKADRVGAAEVAIVLELLHQTLDGRAKRAGGRFEVDVRAGRIELALHGPRTVTDELIERLGQALRVPPSEARLTRAMGKLLAEHRERGPSGHAAASLSAHLLGLSPDAEIARRDALLAVDHAALTRAWQTLLDPRDAVLVVHAASPMSEHDATLDQFGRRWRGKGSPFKTKRATSLERLRGTGDTPTLVGALTGEGELAPIRVLSRAAADSSTRTVVFFGRVIPTPTPRDRALARLSQRLLQQELDARLVVAGPISLLVVRVKLARSKPSAPLASALRRFAEVYAKPVRREHLHQTANLWLGARVVEASLDGEDLTQLWSESIDLASDDAQLQAALARDAAVMLSVEPAQLQQWQREQLDTSNPELGWAWVAAGLSEEAEASLGQLADFVAAH